MCLCMHVSVLLGTVGSLTMCTSLNRIGMIMVSPYYDCVFRENHSICGIYNITYLVIGAREQVDL